MGVFEPGKGARLRVVAAACLIVCMAGLLAAAPSTGCSANTQEEKHASSPGLQAFSGTGVADRQLLGLCSHDMARDFKSKAPASEWPYVRNVRLNLTWSLIERNAKNQFDWTGADAQVNSALSVGLNSILVTLSGPVPGWATDKNAPDPRYSRLAPPKKMEYWHDFCYAVAKRYKGYVDFYQIWQEPGWDIDAPPAADGTVYFGGICDLQYMELLRAGYQGIKKADPEAYVATGSLLNGLTKTANDFKNYELLLAGSGQDVSMKVESTHDIVAERPMYFNYHGAWGGGHDESGVAAPGRSWYLAEGATHPGFEQWICIQNPGNNAADVVITYMFPGGSTQDQAVRVGPHSRYTVDVNLAVGPYRDVSAKVSSTQPVVVERPMYFNYHGAWPGGSIEAGVSELANTWYLAEGATHPGFEQWISLMNPNGQGTNIDITYMFKGGKTQKQSFYMPPTSRETVLVNDVVGPNKDVSAKIESTMPIIAERPMYFNYHGAWPGGHSQVGATEAATSWFLSEGTTRNNQYDGSFEMWISIQNPGDSPAEVDLTYMFTGGETSDGRITVPAHARETILVNDKVGSDRDVSVRLDSSVPIIVERPMYFNYHNSKSGGDVEIASRNAGKVWYFAEGTTREGFEQWLTLQNPNPTPATATVTYMFARGTTQLQTVSLPPNSRTTIGVNESLSIATICDGIAVHPYHYPENWAQYYNTVRTICDRNGHGGLEVIVTEIGWPHGGKPGYSMEGQRQAVGDTGIGSLWGAGCRKIWLYEDVDEPPGTSWDSLDAGMFTYQGATTPAWGEYKRWQSVLLDYGNKPTSFSN